MYRIVVLLALAAVTSSQDSPPDLADGAEERDVNPRPSPELQYKVPNGDEASEEGTDWKKTLKYSPKLLSVVPTWGRFPFQCTIFCICGPPQVKHLRCDRNRAECCKCCEQQWSDCIWRKWGYSHYYCYQQALKCLCKCNKEHACC